MRRILVVDDDRHTRLAMGIWLKQPHNDYDSQ
jgi:hypothetical protein